MRVCGVEIKSNEAVICLLSFSDGVFDLPDCRVRSLTMKKTMDANELRYFQSTFAKLMEDYQVEKVFIKERLTKGKFAGSAIGFKMEAAIQLIENSDVRLFSQTEVKEILKKHPLPVPFESTELKKFQESAFITAYCGLVSR